MSKIIRNFLIFFSLKNIGLGDQVLIKIFLKQQNEHETVPYFLQLMSSSSHIRRVEISGKPRSFRQYFDVYVFTFQLIILIQSDH